jgi:hypothetical protein
MPDDHDFDNVQAILDAELENLENEAAELYDDIERYARVANAMDSTNRGDDADYFREKAVDTYQSLTYVLQMKKDFEDDDTVLGDRYEF